MLFEDNVLCHFTIFKRPDNLRQWYCKFLASRSENSGNIDNIISLDDCLGVVYMRRPLCRVYIGLHMRSYYGGDILGVTEKKKTQQTWHNLHMRISIHF